ncbi:GntR family transcriptional regulator [Mycetocola zhujimingii]|uniref:GntR family transcriptional regulator n=1 Tax=Mycetocola zhujimingii TaxID=2079792 RepID=A0A2U1TD87_9MICO|nr:GntR family transcriptional regulator [Mycetocola zhujimingii]AWB85296.1 GntR family transcriptional regulator [Mycetocola zhujimingii]PWC06849.1 GntR family transcriptional regulator [Mycetocola zhujimingii]
MRASDKAYDVLKEDILSWKLRPGTVLGETEQSERLGISRTPLREAITRLAAEGLVDTQRGRAGVVTDVSAANLAELFELREALETQAARLAARRRSASVFEALRADFESARATVAEDTAGYYALVARLDAAIDDAMANRFLLSSLKGLRGHLARARRLAQDNPDRLTESIGEHLLIVQAILDRDELLAAQATAVHLRKSLTNLLDTAALNAGAPESSMKGTQ